MNENFKETIKAYLDDFAKKDRLFAKKYANPEKNIDECVNYILGWVYQSGSNGFCDEEIFGQAKHYYDEEKVEIVKFPAMRAVVNHHVKSESKRSKPSGPIAKTEEKSTPKPTASKLKLTVGKKSETSVKTENKKTSTNLSLWDEL